MKGKKEGYREALHVTALSWGYVTVVVGAVSVGFVMLAAKIADPFVVNLLFALQTAAVLFCGGRYFGLSHPLCFFPVFFYLYSSWYTYRLLLFAEVYDAACLAESLRISMVALIGYFIPVAVLAGPKHSAVNREMDSRAFKRFQNSQRFVAVLGKWSAAAGVALFLGIAVSGVRSKHDLLAAGGLVLSVATYAAWLANAAALLCFVGDRPAHRWRAGVLAPAAAMGVVAYLAAGERDHLLRLVFAGAVLASERHRRIGLLACVALAVSVPMVVALSNMFKASLLSGEIYHISDFAAEYFSGEFISAGRNAYEIVCRGVSPDWKYFFNDLVRGLTPPGVDLGFVSATGWFHSIYRVDHNFAGSAGWGLGFVAEGIICDGEVGAFVVLFYVGFVVSMLYRYRLSSPCAAVFYALAATSAVYCIRADVANLMSMVFKLGLISSFGPLLLQRTIAGSSRVSRLDSYA